MYLPEIYRNTNREEIVQFINKYNFADLVSVHEGKIASNKVPLYFDEDKNRLLGHFGITNPQLQDLEKGNEVLVIFSGEHSYISPQWYVSKNAVPTWNFQTLQIRGRPKILNEEALIPVLKLLTEKHEAAFDLPWTIESVDKDILKKITKMIAAFQIDIAHIDFKEKFGQNRTRDDRAAAIKGLEAEGSNGAVKTANIMRKGLV